MAAPPRHTLKTGELVVIAHSLGRIDGDDQRIETSVVSAFRRGNVVRKSASDRFRWKERLKAPEVPLCLFLVLGLVWGMLSHHVLPIDRAYFCSRGEA